MKALFRVAAVLGAFLAGVAVHSFLSNTAKTRLGEANAALQQQLEDAQRAKAKAIAQRDGWASDAERLRKQADEVHSLRAEIARLRTELAQKSAAPPVQQVPEGSKTNLAKSEIQAAALAKKEKGAVEKNVPIENTPPAVSAIILREMQRAPTNGVYVQTVEGRNIYGTKGSTPDGRTVALKVAEDGTVLMESNELPAASVPEHVQAIVSKNFGDIAIGHAQEILEDNQVRYELSAKGPQSAMQITVAADGTLLGYSARLRSPKEEPRKK